MYSPSSADAVHPGPRFDTLWSMETIGGLFRENGREWTAGGLECPTQ